MSVMIDLNILLDVLQAREPWYADAQAIWKAQNQGVINGYIAAHGLTTLFYLMRRAVGADEARAAVRLCLQTFEVVPVGRPELERADGLNGGDFEDNVVLACAIHANLDAIVTRDPRGFADAPMPVLAPGDLLDRVMGS